MDSPDHHSIRRFKIVLEYDGTEYVGWQVQPNGKSIQETMEKTLAQFIGAPVSVVGAGRTDSGVHARGQVAHADIATSMSCDQLRNALNALLPRDLVAVVISEVESTFHARYSAVERRYTYTITTRPVALDRRLAWYVPFPLEFSLLAQCCTFILGEHDFTAFTKDDANVKHHRCTVRSALWEQREHRLVFFIAANRFLHHMVRSLVGTMVEVGRGYFTTAHFAGLFESRNRADAGPTAPPAGLVLEEVVYD